MREGVHARHARAPSRRPTAGGVAQRTVKLAHRLEPSADAGRSGLASSRVALVSSRSVHGAYQYHMNLPKGFSTSAAVRRMMPDPQTALSVAKSMDITAQGFTTRYLPPEKPARTIAWPVI